MLVGELDEDVFEAGSEWTDFGDGNPVFQKLFAEIVKIKMILDESMDGLPENGGSADAGEMAREAQRACDFRSGDFHAQRAVRLHVGKLEQKVPELAARDGIDAGGGFVEEKKPRLVQHRAAKGEALLPAAGKLRGQAIQIRFEAIELHNFVDASLEPRGLEAVDAAVELQIFRDSEIVVETEVLRHVTDAFAHGFGIGADIQAFNLGVTAA